MSFDRESEMYVNTELIMLESDFEHINRKELYHVDSDPDRHIKIKQTGKMHSDQNILKKSYDIKKALT